MLNGRLDTHWLLIEIIKISAWLCHCAEFAGVWFPNSIKVLEIIFGGACVFPSSPSSMSRRLLNEKYPDTFEAALLAVTQSFIRPNLQIN